MDASGIARLLDERFGAGTALVYEDLEPQVALAPDRLVDACRYLRDAPDLRLDYMRCLTGIDLPPDAMVVVIHLVSTVQKHRLILRVETSRERPSVPSVEEVWPGAGWYEREVFDLLGVDFPGNRDLRRILLPDEWIGHPLRKDYRESKAFFGIPTQRPDSIRVVRENEPGRKPAGGEREQEPAAPDASVTEAAGEGS